ncbi:putative HTH-type transcriptional regulator YcgE [Plantactinospora endophytica]|uniref:HTH-type transcriptional regulator YcgE n=1 Tax=Plantactinospora endophytica TaxID=673535 RepID=A0ABQ4DZA9_9ACTN|nr:putative HTH-type transcriptional regulator YcgE [Plantactinospora endophytica]
MIVDLIRAWRAARLQTDLLDDAAFHKLGINRTDGRCLDALSEGPMTATALATACGVTVNALTTVVDRLAERGLIERIRDTVDRRRVVIRLTELADHVSNQLYGPVVAWSINNFNRYTTKELEILERFLTEGREFQKQHMEYIRELDLSWEPGNPDLDATPAP